VDEDIKRYHKGRQNVQEGQSAEEDTGSATANGEGRPPQRIFGQAFYNEMNDGMRDQPQVMHNRSEIMSESKEGPLFEWDGDDRSQEDRRSRKLPEPESPLHAQASISKNSGAVYGSAKKAYDPGYANSPGHERASSPLAD